MNVNQGKILIAGLAVFTAAVTTATAVRFNVDPPTKEVPLPGPTVTEIVNRPFTVPVPGPTVTKKVVITKTVRPKIPKEASRSNERKTPRKSVSLGSPQAAAKTIFGSQYSCAAAVISRESGWNVRATNPSSGAYGLGQALPPSKMAPYGSDWRTSARTQLTWMKAYLDGRYGGACAGWEFWQGHLWY